MSGIVMTSTPPSGDKLELVRNKLREARDLQREIMDLEQRLKDTKKSFNTIVNSTLVDVFDQNGVTALSLEAEGNLPAYKAEVKPYYSANIKAEWDQDKKLAGYKVLEKEGGGHLVKTTFTVNYAAGDRKAADDFRKLLDKNKVPYSATFGVHSQSLTAWLKEYVEQRKKVPPLDAIGGTVGRVVVIKQVKNG